jgi:outer membrane scaffolding protein for murein synthesis (MipA/OmpV family)
MARLLTPFIFILFVSSLALAEDAPVEESAYWDYGVAIGAVRYEQYPASDEYSYLALPAPTFQYRGKIVRADDKDGAHIYLFKGSYLTLELSGDGTPALDSAHNKAREGMDDLPWLIGLGPELVYRGLEDFEFGLGVFQVITTDFKMTRFSGEIFSGRVTYNWNFPFKETWPFTEDGFSNGKLTLALKGGTQEYQSIYFEVPENNATAERPTYHAQDGFLSHDLSYYQSFKSGHVSLYVGAAWHGYDLSANRQSPLHKSNNNFIALVGFNYVIGESAKPAVPFEDTSGVINSIKRNRETRQPY